MALSLNSNVSALVMLQGLPGARAADNADAAAPKLMLNSSAGTKVMTMSRSTSGRSGCVGDVYRTLSPETYSAPAPEVTPKGSAGTRVTARLRSTSGRGAWKCSLPNPYSLTLGSRTKPDAAEQRGHEGDDEVQVDQRAVWDPKP